MLLNFLISFIFAFPVINILSSTNSGTAFFITQQTSISAKHVCEGGMHQFYYKDQNDTYVVKKIILSKTKDLCFIEWDRKNPNATVLSISSNFQLYNGLVSYIGYPNNILTISVNKNLLEKSQFLYSIDKDSNYYCLARLNALPGSSGSPVVNSENEIIGVIVALDRTTSVNAYICTEDLYYFLKNEVKIETF